MTDFPIRLIATDLDGTLLDHQGQMVPENVGAIRAAQEMGVTVAVATGRFPENAYLKMQDSGLACPIMGENGANIMDAQLRPLAMHVMDTEAAKRTLEVILSFGADSFIFGHRTICTTRPDGHHHSELSQGERIVKLGIGYVHGPEAAREIVLGPVHKFYICDNVPLAPLRRALREIPGIAVTRSAENNVEVMPRGVDKGSGLKEFAAYLGVPMQQVMALGDHDNDAPMLRAAGFGVAMGNGSERAKKAARFLTADCREGGFARAVERFVLGGEREE